MDDYERVKITNRDEWRQWLVENHSSRSQSIWLVTHKKHCGPTLYVPYSDIVEEALCFGWIDSVPRKLDNDRTMVLVSPRRKGSVWSKCNKDRVSSLIRKRLMAPSGLATVKAAKQDGSWAFLDDVEAMIVPPDLETQFRRFPRAKTAFEESTTDSAKKQILQNLKLAKQASTRARRIQKAIDDLLSGSKSPPKAKMSPTKRISLESL